MDDILKELGWGDGFRIPVANEENRALELEVQKKQNEKENLKSVLENITDRVTGMKKHYENVKQQLDQNQNLIFANNNQKAAEENLTKLARTEDNALSVEIKKVKKQEMEIQDRLSGVQMDIDRALQHIDKLNNTIKWDKDALLAFDEEVSRGDDDTIMLEKFKKEDETKFRELEQKRQYLGVEVENKRNRLICIKNDIASMEQSLDKTAQMFKRQHVDRRSLVQQWEASVRVLHERDEDINRVMEEIGNLKSLGKERLKDLEEQKTFFENEVKNNKEMERDIEDFNKQICDSREKIKLMESIIAEEKDKLGTMKTILATASAEVHKEIAKQKSIVKEIAAKEILRSEMLEKYDKAKEYYENCKNKTISASERVKQLEDILAEEEKTFEKNQLEFKKLNELMYQVIQQINELKSGEKTQTVSLEHLENCRASTNKDIAKAKLEWNRQREFVYNMDFAYMEKDILYNKMLGVKYDKDSEKYDKRVRELEKIQVELAATNVFLTKEVSRLQEEMRKLAIDLQGDAKEQDYLKNKRQENIMLVECGNKQLKILRHQNQDKQVDENVLKLRVKQAESAIDKVGGNVFSLEKQRLELEHAIKEREVEIKALRDVLQVRRRVLKDQASNMNSRVSLAKLKVEHLKNKYDVEILKLGKDENGEPLSITYFKVKNVQERFELQELGDKLDSKIKKTEKEIEAMENTLKVVNASNKAFKNNLQSLNPESPEQVEKVKLEETHAHLLAEYRKKKAVLDSLTVITMDLEEEYQQKIRIEESIIGMWKEKDQLAAETDKELKDQEEKLERAEKQLKRLVKEIRGTKMHKFQTVEEKDIELREIMEQNEYSLQQLAELVAKTYDTGPVVTRYLAEKGLTLPMVKSPAVSLKCPSTASLPSARSSVSSRSSKSSSTKSERSESAVSRSSSCVFTPSVVTLDSTGLTEKKKSSEALTTRKPCGFVRSKNKSNLKKNGGN